jgi:signal transduction histidine kinase
MMLRTLQGKLALALIGLLLLIALLLVPMTLFISRIARQESNQVLNRRLAANAVKGKTLLRDGVLRRAEANEVLTAVERLHPGSETYVLNPRGEVIAASEPMQQLSRRQIDIKPLELFLQQGQAPILGENPRDPANPEVFSVARLTASGNDEGYLYIILDSTRYASPAALISRSYAVRMRLLATFGVLICALAAGLVLFGQLTRRLTNLAQAMQNFQRQDFSGAVTLSSGRNDGDEIDRLTAIFARMARRIEEQIEELRRSDALRREMVSNASHDLRTPLAALRGYLETLVLREGRLSREEQREFAQTAMRHGERLSELVEELFELTKLEAIDAQPRVEPFPLGELLQDVAQKYQLRAQQQGVALKTELGPNVPFVCADIGLIERVLENLIENALRHTPRGGSIILELRATAKGRRVRAQVIDTGSGIAPEDLPHIFDRFYRAKNPVANGEANGKKSGAGLGLSIAKRALELHGSNLTARSAPGKGATFTFDLDAYTGE